MVCHLMKFAGVLELVIQLVYKARKITGMHIGSIKVLRCVYCRILKYVDTETILYHESSPYVFVRLQDETK